MTGFQRARSSEAKQAREAAILDAARALGAARGIRGVTLTDIAEAVGMHKSAMLRYFETREQIFLRLTASGWQDWSSDLLTHLAHLTAPADAAPAPGAASPDAAPVRGAASPDAAPVRGAASSADAAPGGDASPEVVARVFAATLAARPLFCDLLAQAPLNLERNVSLESVREFKLVTLGAVDAITAELGRLLGLDEQQSVDVISTATSLAGALFQMATPGPELEALYRADPRFAHALVDVEPRLIRVLTALLDAFTRTA